MYPTFQILGRTIATYGLMIVIGFFFGVALAVIRRQKYNLHKDDVIFSSCFAGIGLLIGAKLLYILTILPNLIRYRNRLFSDPSQLLPVLSGGFVYYGGLIGAVIGFVIYCRIYHINLLNLLDLIAPSIPLIHGFGRLGCLSAGCCYGKAYNGPFHLEFQISPFAPNNIALFPTQPMESTLNFIACAFLLLYARGKHRTGKVIGIYLIYYAITRFTLEFYRGDIARGLILGISTSQWISLALLPFAIWIYMGAKPIKILNKDITE
jgi:phosphatidylglycerol---prolipoprotein diacylglyceryl transferase